MKYAKSWLFAAKLAFSTLLLWFVLTKIDRGSIVSRLHTADIRWLLPSFLIGPVAVLLSAWRWRELSLGLLGYGEAVRYTWIGLFFGTIVPGLVGGDVAKGLSLAAKESRARDSRLPVSIIMDKLVGFWVLLLMFSSVAIALLFMHVEAIPIARMAIWIATFATVTGLSAGIAICHPRSASWATVRARLLPIQLFRRFAGSVLGAIDNYAGKSRLLVRAALISAGIHSLNILSLWLVMHSLSIPATLWFAAMFYPLLSFLLALPVSVSGVGVRDVFAAGMFTAFHLNPSSGVAFSWLLLAVGIPNAFVGGGIQLWEMFHRRAAS